MSPAKQNGHGNGNGAGKGPIDDLDALIRDRDDDFDVEFEHPRGDYDPYADFASAQSSEGGGPDRGLIEAITRIIEALAGVAGDALAPEARRQLEKTLRDLLVALRDSLDWVIERIDERQEDDFEIEEIPID